MRLDCVWECVHLCVYERKKVKLIFPVGIFSHILFDRTFNLTYIPNYYKWVAALLLGLHLQGKHALCFHGLRGICVCPSYYEHMLGYEELSSKFQVLLVELGTVRDPFRVLWEVRKLVVLHTGKQTRGK